MSHHRAKAWGTDSVLTHYDNPDANDKCAVSAAIHAPARAVYPILADYRNHHPHILPKAYFTGLEVEEGGTGEGTVFRAALQIMGQKQRFRMRVTSRSRAG